MLSYLKILTLIVLATLLHSCGPSANETKPVRKNITESVFASGVLVPEDQYDLTPLNDGYIVKLNFTEGDTVRQGQDLAVIENRQNVIGSESAEKLLAIAKENTLPTAPELKQADVNINLAKLKLKQDELQEQRYKKLLESNSVSKLEYENAKLAMDNSKANLDALQESYKQLKSQAEQQLIAQKNQTDINKLLTGYSILKAVVGGKVYKKMKETGDYIKKGDIIAEIGAPSSLYAKLSVDENNISKVKVGLGVIIQLNTEPNKFLKGIITEIYPAFDEQTQSFYCKAKLDDNLDFKVAGTQLQANIIIGEKQNALVIPREYMSYGNKVKTKGKGDVTIIPGFISSEWVEIDSGLDENTTIVKPKL
jgi:multidrug efflux pump subunit AcrA (membrane-fusion protein)